MSESQMLAERLKTEGEKIAGIFSALGEEQWRAEIYTEDQIWTTREALAHFVTSERGLVKLFESVRMGGAGAAEDFSIDRYNAVHRRRPKT